MRADTLIVGIARSIARVLVICLFLLWGTFFLEHLQWFVAPAERMPPFQVWLAQFFHLVMLLRFLLAWKWELPGSGLITVSAFLFFVQTAGDRFALFFGITIIPAALYFLCWMISRSLSGPQRASAH